MKVREVGARVLSFGRKRLMGMGLRLGQGMPGDAPDGPFDVVLAAGAQYVKGSVSKGSVSKTLLPRSRDERAVRC